VARSIEPVGRVDFVLRILLLTAAVVAIEHFLPDKTLARLHFIPEYLRPAPRILGICLAVGPLGDTLRGRLQDARLPDWIDWPAFLLWLFSAFFFFLWNRYSVIGLVLFALMVILGGVIPSKLIPAEILDDEKVEPPTRTFPERLMLGPIEFLRSLLTIGCLWLPLIWLEDTFTDDLGLLIARAGYFVLGFVWLINTIRRFEDAGRSSQWYGLFYLSIPIVAMVPLWLRLINGYESLLLFVLIQLPLAMLRSKRNSAALMVAESVGSEALMNAETKDQEIDRQPTKTKKMRQVRPISPKGFFVTLLVIFCFWSLMIYLDDASGHGVGSWIAWIGYVVLVFTWFGNVARRLKDAGWAHGLLPAQYCIVVLVATLMPHAFHWVTGYGALAIFVLIQIPIVFLPSKPRPEEPLPESSVSDDNENCLRDPLEGILVRRTDEAGITYQRPTRSFLKGRGLGVSNWAPKRKRY
jgi:uncharacterized membrane protein YhaH (DUF805 family)